MKLLLLEDAPPLRRALATGLHKAGYAVDVCADRAEGFWFADNNDYNVIIRPFSCQIEAVETAIRLACRMANLAICCWTGLTRCPRCRRCWRGGGGRSGHQQTKPEGMAVGWILGVAGSPRDPGPGPVDSLPRPRRGV